MKQRGFTLLETVIVLAIMTMFFAISIPLFTKFTDSTKLDTTARSITSALRTARAYAITNNANYYVKFDKAPTPNEYYVYSKPAGVVTINDKKYKLPVGIWFYDPSGGDEIRFTADGGDSACFKPTGELDEPAGIDTRLYIADKKTAAADYKIILVERTTGRARIIE